MEPKLPEYRSPLIVTAFWDCFPCDRSYQFCNIIIPGAPPCWLPLLQAAGGSTTSDCPHANCCCSCCAPHMQIAVACAGDVWQRMTRRLRGVVMRTTDELTPAPSPVNRFLLRVAGTPLPPGKSSSTVEAGDRPISANAATTHSNSACCVPHPVAATAVPPLLLSAAVTTARWPHSFNPSLPSSSLNYFIVSGCKYLNG